MTRRRRLALVLGLLLGLGASGEAAQLSTRALTPVAAAPEQADAPILRIDADFHTQTVNQLAQDSRHRIIVTVSDDKTIRSWATGTGEALGTLRVPIAPGDEGALYAAAISPDDKTLLVAGATGFTWDKAFAVYLFDLETGKLKGRLPNLPGPVNDIAYAPDGHAFALAMGNGGGVWLVDATNGSLIASDVSFTERVKSVAFDHRGRLYAASLDGVVRLYDATGHRVADRVPVPGGHAFRVAVSPDDRFVAVGYDDQPRVEVLNARDLSTRASLQTGPSGARDSGDASLGAVAWTRDGGLIAAGSLAGSDGRKVLRRWPASLGRPSDVPLMRDTVFSVAATDDGGALAVGADPALVRVDRAGRVVWRHDAPGLDFRDMRRFSVSQDGSSVTIQTARMSAPWPVDLPGRRVGLGGSTRALTPIPAPAAEPVSTTDVSDWYNGSSPRIGGRAVRLAPQEVSRSVAATPSGQFVLLGTDYRLRVYRHDGAEVGGLDLPGAVWAVGVSGDSRMVVAGVGDGTLRWFGLDENGGLVPLVSLFLAADGRRWVAWTDDGHFDYADTGGGEGMVGLLVNRAKNQVPSWYSFAQVYRRLYSPDIVSAALHGRPAPNETASVEPMPQASGSGSGSSSGSTSGSSRPGTTARLSQLASNGAPAAPSALSKTPPPVIELVSVCWIGASGRDCSKLATTATSRSLSTEKGDTKDVVLPPSVTNVTVQFRLTGADEGSSAVDVFVNGRNGGRAMRQVSAKGEAIAEQTTALDPGDNKLQLRAYDHDQQTYAESRPIVLGRSAPPPPATGKPNLFVLAVGVNAYQSGINQLAFAVPDAKSVSDAIKAHAPSTYGNVNVVQLFDKDASADNVLHALGDIGAQATARDTVLIYLSGHGGTFDQRYYFVTQNVPSVDRVTSTALSEGALVTALAAIKSNNTMLFLDTCHAGAFSLDAASALAHETGRYILAAAASEQEALDSFDDRNGVFATAVLRGLGGQAAEGRKLVDNFELGLFVTPMVQELAEQKHHNQSARFKIEADDARPFPIVAIEQGAPAN